MNKYLPLLIATALLAACDARVTNPPSEKVIEKNTTIITPAAKEPKVEKNTIIVTPPATTTTREKTTKTTTE